ncbi:MAG: hypothetical protein JSU77_12070 [Fidelibacterota bacterium]|nr:MAG: hypothetical protein JSU77_12070 [Candidatus Neomarinimicrobiota bacterium]
MLPIIINAQIREYRIHDRGMLHETVFNTGEIGRGWMTGEAGNKTSVPVFEWPSRSFTILEGIEYSGQHNILGAGVYIGANIDTLPGEDNRLFALCGGVGASSPEVAFGRWSFPLYMNEVENFPVLPDGSLNTEYDPDEAEEIITAAWASSTGISVTRVSRAWSYPDYDDMIIYEYTFEYTGDTDGNPATQEMTEELHDVMIAFNYGFAPSMYGYQRHYQEWKYTGGIYRGDQNNFWDTDYWLSFNMNLRTFITDENLAGKPEPNKELFRQFSQTGENGGGLCSPQAPGYCVLYYDTTHLALVIPEKFDSLGLNESEAADILRTTNINAVDENIHHWYSENADGTFTWYYELDKDAHIKQPWSNKVSTGNTNSIKMMYEKDAFNPNTRWSGVYSPKSTTWPDTPSEWYGRAAYPYRQSADAGQKHTVFGPYSLEIGDTLRYAVAEVVGYGAEPGKMVEGGQVAEQWAPTPSWDRKIVIDNEVMTEHYLTDYGYPDYVNSDSVITVTQVAHKAFRAYLGHEPELPVWPEDNSRTGSYKIPVPVPAPAITVENTEDGNVRITWNRAVEDFEHPRLMGTLTAFNVYRSNAGMGPWDSLGTFSVGEVDASSNMYEFIDDDPDFKVGDIRYYAVTSIDQHGNQSGKTNITKFSKNIAAVEKLDKVYVVPNPFVEKSYFEKPELEGAIGFYGLPEKCTIRIFSYAGQLVQTIEHDDAVYSTAWLQVTRNAQVIASGIYYYVVSTPNGDQASGKFIIIK